MTRQSFAFMIHLLTASGAAVALFAMLAAAAQDWKMMFFWLGLALFIDGIDGPLARMAQVKTYAPHWDGILLDLIIDFLTYAFIPAYALARAGLMPEWEGWLLAIVIVSTSAMYFADTRMKTPDNSFSGFPSCWNMVVLVCFALTPPPWVILAVVALLALAQFFPLKFIHPVRTERLHRLSLGVTLLWCGFALWTMFADFRTPPLAAAGLIVTSLYLMLVGLFIQFVLERDAA
jgi:phosphatidylcholine synthase